MCYITHGKVLINKGVIYRAMLYIRVTSSAIQTLALLYTYGTILCNSVTTLCNIWLYCAIPTSIVLYSHVYSTVQQLYYIVQQIVQHIALCCVLYCNFYAIIPVYNITWFIILNIIQCYCTISSYTLCCIKFVSCTT